MFIACSIIKQIVIKLYCLDFDKSKTINLDYDQFPTTIYTTKQGINFYF